MHYYFKITCLSFLWACMLEKVSRNLKEVIKLIFFTLDMPRYFIGQTGNQFAHEILSHILHACMRLRIPTCDCHLYIMIDLNTFFFLQWMMLYEEIYFKDTIEECL